MSEQTELNIGLYYELRNPQFKERSWEDLTEAVVEQAVLADELGFDSFWSSEHHFAPDGETPTPLMLAAAVAARTKRIRLGTDLMVLPLHHPVRLAEDAAFLSILSRGRFDLGLAAGYVEEDFEAFGQKLSYRPSLMEEGIEILKKSWSGEPFSYSGKRWTLPEVTVLPVPRPENRTRLMIGGFAPAAIARAAKYGDGFMCASLEGTAQIYLDALTEAGKDHSEGWISASAWWVVAEDPEKVWAEIGKHGLYQVNKYVAAGVFGDMPLFTDPADLLERKQFEIHDGASAVARLKELKADYPQLADLHMFAVLPGEEVESAGERVEYVAKTVLPHFTSVDASR
ncbi:MAG: LLM class flavin-dependent oxidoreductase [Patulibacter sp.]|nr:LLM class flavin-dependent oxidoreductase [Patulibacter sp.]